jgi:hypothetical protein
VRIEESGGEAAIYGEKRLRMRVESNTERPSGLIYLKTGLSTEVERSEWAFGQDATCRTGFDEQYS